MFAASRRILFVLAFACGPMVASAQDPLEDLLGIGNLPGVNTGAQIWAELVTGKAEVGETAYLRVHADLPPDHYIYSLDPAFDGHTEIRVLQVVGLVPIDAGFVSVKKPKVKFEPVFKKDIGKHYDRGVWVQRFRIADPATARVSGELSGQYCTDGPDGQGGNCTPIRPPAKFDADIKVEEELTDAPPPKVLYRHQETPTRGRNNQQDPLSLEFTLTQPANALEDEIVLGITMDLDEGWHAYSQKQNPDHAGLPVKLEVTGLSGLEPVDAEFVPDHPPERLDPLGDGKEQLQFHGRVTWTRRFRSTAKKFAMTGSINYQVCQEACLPPKTVAFALGDPGLKLQAAPPSGSAKKPTLAKTDGGAEADEEAAEETATGSLPQFLLFAFLGGLILNVMPCVLPVLAIKILSFAKQAGESRSRVLILNFAYSAGVISVFLALAAMAVGLSFGGQKLGWGQLFQKSEFNLVMAAVIFTMGLSLLGVFEIPIPGVGGGGGKEGPFGAFLTGILATLLATPCSGPFMGVTLAWSVKQPAVTTFLVWGVMGVGMASPYILFALVPGAVKILPKPGMWMVRFKEIAGFVLLATVIYFVSFLEQRFIIPLLIGLLALGFALWMIGSLYEHGSPKGKKMRVRLTALAMCALGMFTAYKFTDPASASGTSGEMAVVNDGKTLPWRSFSEEKLLAVLDQKQTVIVDFTADW